MHAVDEKKSSSLFGKTASGLGWQMSSSVIKYVAQFGIGIALARLLPPEDFGIVGGAYIATGLASILTDLGLGPALIQRRELTERHVRVCYTFSVVGATIIAGALFAGAGLIATIFNDPRVEPVLQVLAFMFPFAGLGTTASSLLTRRMAFSQLVKLELFTSIIGYGGVAVTMAATGFGYWSLVGGTFVKTVLDTVLKLAVVRHNLRPLASRAELSELLGFSTGISLAGIANYFARQGDYFVVGRLMDATSLGFYSRAYSLMTLPLSFFGNALSRVLYPAASKLQDDQQRFRRAFIKSFVLSLAVSTPLSFTVAIIADEIILVLYGDKWTATIPLLQILALFGAFRMTYNTASTFVKAKGYVYGLLACEIVYGIVVIAGSWWAGLSFGLAGVAWAVGVGICTMWLLVVGIALTLTEIRITDFARECIKGIWPVLVGTSLIFVIVSAMRAIEWPNILIVFVSCLLLTSILVYLIITTVSRSNNQFATRMMNRGMELIPGISWRVNTNI